MKQQPRDLESMSISEKRELLAELLDDSGPEGSSTISREQRRLWMLQQLEEEAPWQVTTALRIAGKLDLATLQLALTEVLERHEVLRMSFVEVGGQPLGTVIPAATLRLPVVDVETADHEAELAKVARREARTRFDIGQAPLVRGTVVRLGPESHVLVLTLHQLVADVRSLRLVTDELVAVYNGLTAGGNSGLPPVPVDFANLVTAEAEWLGSHSAEEDSTYWREQLAALAPLELPTDRRRPAKKTIAAAAVSTELDEGLTAGLADLAERSGHELFDVLLAGCAAILGRYALQREFAVGVPAPPSWYEGADALAGPLENMLPLRLSMAGDESLEQLVAHVASVRAEALEHGRLPFDRIVEAAQPQRDLSRTPFFQVSFRHEEAPKARELSGATVTETELDSGWTPHDIDFTAVRHGDVLRLTARFNTDLFDAATVERLLRHIGVLLSAAVEEPLRAIAALPLLTEEEQSTVLGWGTSESAEPDAQSLHALFEQQVARTPDAVALTCGESELTYRQLDERANFVAHRLIEGSTGPKNKVGVVVERSVESVAGLLGVLKAGGAYVPLDAAYPADRLKFIREDADLDTVVGTRATLDGLAGGFDGADEVEIPTAARTPEADPSREIEPAALAYQIYTSGSTGRPKGVSVEHRQVVHSTAARTALEEKTGLPERYLLLAPLTFDASGGGLYWTLSRGGNVVIPTDAEVHDPRQLGKLIRAKEITHLDGVPSQYGVLLESDLGSHESLRCCILAGEALPPSLVAEHYERSPQAVLFNEYGPTETTIWASVRVCAPGDSDRVRVPIGRPVSGVRLYVLDEHLNPVPPGVVGELYIGGDGVARGYGKQPGMSATHFLPDPFSDRPGARVYRTGDRARFLPEGELEFLSRVDNQVKIRGFRVELSEIENVLLRHPLVTEAVVTVPTSTSGPQRLVAYVVPSSGRVLTQEALATYTVGQLPDYMVPSQFVSLEQLPLTKHGKVDYAALPAPEETAGPGGHVEPQSQLEAEIAETFADVLGVSRVDATATFFELGGDSLLVARLVARLGREHDVDLPIDEIFKVPTVQGVGRAVEAYKRRQGAEESEVEFAQQLADLLAEVKLDPGIVPGDLPRGNFQNPQHVLITGASGYLGAFIVAEAIKRTDAVVHCLVRAEDEESAQARLEEVMNQYRTWDDAYRERLRPIVGDLAKPRLGLSKEIFEELAGKIDSIYHSGAVVNFTYPYEAMKPANVHGTEELLRLASTTKLKAFNHVSSVDVFMGSGAPRPFTEDDLTDNPPRIPTGYPRTKWISEKLVVLARDRGLPVIVHRPWMVTGHRTTGAAHNTDYLYVYLKGFLELGMLPLYDDVVNAVPVDFTVESILYTSTREENYGKTFNITNANPATMSQCYNWLRSFGYELNVVDEEEARQQALAVDQDHTLYPLTPILRVASMRHDALDPDLQKRIDPADECRTLLAALEGSGIECPPVNEELAHDCFRYLIDTGFLPAPENAGTAS
ncbi:amino acid adenylation domain-containing protein [Actinopolyspora saharensis]|uniref:non-ribosomal peptide synthetase family protein n=1 Tax=Actinopolyspora saharensis TaxID=995062 RepID=UPI003F66D87D